MRFHMIKLFAVVSILGTVIYGSAQDTPRIEYGDTVSGEITNREFEIPFDFEGSDGDIIIIEMQPVDLLGDLNRPEILLLDEKGDIVADTSQSYSYRGALLALELPDDGLYTILASRADGRAGDSVGEFNLILTNPVELVIGEPIEGTVRNSSASGSANTAYYAIQGDEIEPLILAYERTDGEYAPEIALNRINEDYALEAIASLSGDELVSGTITLPDSDDIFIVSLGRSLFSYNFDEIIAEYELTLSSE